jgi:hypothetical protein
MNKRDFLKVLPYLASIGAGFVFYFIGLELSEYVRVLFTGISAAFFAIPLIYLFYQRAYNASQKNLNKEIFDYAKMQIDRYILSIINQLQKLVYPLEGSDLSPKGVSKFLSIEKDKLKEVLSKNEYLGFQVFKSWEVSEENLHELLKSSFILKGLDNDQVISIISIIKSLRYLESIQKEEELYTRTDKETTSYKIVYGKELNKENIKFPDRYLLLRDLGNNKSLVADFGDFPLYNVNKLLQIFTIDKRYLEIYSNVIFDLMREINNWVDLTGGEFVIDTKMFRLRHKVTIDD